MLVLSRQRDESIIIGDNIVVTIVDVRGDKVRLGIEAPREVSVHRREVYEANRWIAQSLFKAFCEAQRRTYHDLQETAALKAMLPWLVAHVEEARREMGDDYWSYGFQQNRKVLETFLRYSFEQGLSKRLLAPEDIFVPETMESFVI